MSIGSEDFDYEGGAHISEELRIINGGRFDINDWANKGNTDPEYQIFKLSEGGKVSIIDGEFHSVLNTTVAGGEVLLNGGEFVAENPNATINITGGTITLDAQNNKFNAFGTEISDGEHHVFDQLIDDGTADRDAKGNIIRYNCVGDVNISGGEINILGKVGKSLTWDQDGAGNYLIGTVINLSGGQLNIEENSGVYVLDGFSKKGNKFLSSVGTINLSGSSEINLKGTMIANIVGDYLNNKININSKNAKIDGSLSGANLVFNADSVLSKLVTGTLGLNQTVNIKSGELKVDKPFYISNLTIDKGATINVTKGVHVGTDIQSSGKITATNADIYAENKVDILQGTLNLKNTDLTARNAALTIADDTTINLNGNNSLWGKSISINGGTINMKGTNDSIDTIYDWKGVSFRPTEDNDLVMNGGTINVSGKKASLGAEGEVIIKNGNINIANNATLYIEDKYFKRSNLNISNGSNLDIKGTLSGNIVSTDTKGNVLLHGANAKVLGTVSNLEALNIIGNAKGNLSNSLKGSVSDLTNLYISGEDINGKVSAPKITIDKSIFNVTDNQRKYFVHEYEKEIGDYGVTPETSATVDLYDYDIDDYVETDNVPLKPYENQISGNLTIDNKADVTINKTFATNNIYVKDGAKLTSYAMLYSNLLDVNNASATITATNAHNMKLSTINVYNESSLTLDYIERLVTNNINVTDSTLTIKKYFEGMVENEFTATNSNIYVTSASLYANSDFSHSDVEFKNAEIGGFINAEDKSQLTFSNTEYWGDISADDSKIILNGGNTIYVNEATFDNASVLTIKGKNTVYGDIALKDSTLDIINKAVLSAGSVTGDNLRLKLSGTLNADLYGTVSTLVLSKTATLMGENLNISGLQSFGISGISSAKDIQKAFDIYKEIANSDTIDTFEITDKSKMTDDKLIASNNIHIENSSLDVKGNLKIQNLNVDTQSTLKVLANATVTADTIKIEDSSFTVGKTLKNALDYSTSVSAGTIDINNAHNSKATVSISNTNVSAPLTIDNTSKTTINNSAIAGNLTLKADEVAVAKGKLVYKTASLSNVQVSSTSPYSLDIQNIKVSLNNVSGFNTINVSKKGFLELKDNLTTTSLNLSDEATATIAQKKTLTSTVNIKGNSVLELKGKIIGNVNGSSDDDGNFATLNIQNANANISGNVSNVKLVLNKIKTSLSNLFSNTSVLSDIKEMKLSGATITADKPISNLGHLNLDKSTLTLANPLSAGSLYMNASKLYLGTHTLTIAGKAEVLDKSAIYLNLDDTGYGRLTADTITFAQGNMKPKNLTLNVTIKKGTNISDGTYSFLSAANGISGNLSKVTVANNIYEFKETENIGTFVVTKKDNAKGVVKRYSGVTNTNLAIAADALVDNKVAFNNVAQTVLSENLDALSQVVGGEKEYVDALKAANPDDTNMVAENTMSQTSAIMAAVSDRTSSGGISSASEGISSGDDGFNKGAVWAKVLFNKTKINESHGYDGYKANNSGMAMGADKYISDDVKLGFGYAYTNGKLKNDIRTSDVDTHTVMLYGEYKPNAWFVNGIASYGWSDYSTKGYSVAGVTKSDYNVYSSALQLTTGYDVKLGQSTVLTPITGVRYLNIMQENYRDSDGKYISSGHNDVVTLLASTKVKSEFELGDDTIIAPEARLGFSYDVVKDNNNSVVSLSNGTSYIVNSRSLRPFGLEAGVGLTAKLYDNVEVTLGYEGHFRKDYQDNTAMLSAKYNF